MLVTWAPRLLSVLRIVAAFLYLLHGTSKLFGVPPTPSGATVNLASRLGAAGAMLGALDGQSSGRLVPLQNQGELPILFCFIFLYLAAAGAGAWSVDAMRRR